MRTKKKFGSENKNVGNKSQGNKDTSKIQYFGCHEYGHYKRDCPKNSKNNKRKKLHEASTAEDEEAPKKPKDKNQKDLYY